MDFKEKIRVIEAPKEGISFKDITTLTGSGEALKESINEMAKFFKDKNVDVVVGPEARGFIFWSSSCLCIRCRIVTHKKRAKVPADTVKVEYDLEYGKDCLEIHKDAIKRYKSCYSR